MSDAQATPTIRDVAVRAEVSPSTVSLVLSGRKNGASRISPETRQRVVEAVRALNYVPSQTARHLRRRKTERVCLVLPSVGLPYDALLIQALRSAASQHGYSVVINVSESVEQIVQVLVQLRAGLADALVLGLGFEYAGQAALAEHLQMLAVSGVPVVALSNHYLSEHHDTVTNTERSSCYEAVRYLLQIGHERVAFLGHTLEHPHHYLRHGSYLRALTDAGLEPDPRLMRAGAATRQAAFESTRALLVLDAPPSAIYCGSDVAAITALSAIHGAGLRVPEDVAVVGTGNIPEAEFAFPPLTTVGPTTRDFAPVAQLLFERIAGVRAAEARVLEQPWSLVRRASA